MKQLIVVFTLLVLSVAVFALPESSDFAKWYGQKSSTYVGLNDYKSAFDFPERLGVQRVTHYDPRVNFARIDSTVYLAPPGVEEQIGAGRGGYAPFYPRGTVRIRSSTWYGYPRAQLTVNTKDLPPSYNDDIQYEVWLVDEDSGYRLSTGTFTTGFGGIGEMWYQIDNYFDAFDWVEITAEPYDDNDVSPGPIALLGRVPPPNFYDPAPKDSKMITETFRYY